MLHDLIKIWFEWVRDWGYWGVFTLMAMESSIIPVPSELVMPPAAYWAAQGKMSFNWVVFAGTAGSYFGSVVNYWLFMWLGAPFIEKYGRYFLLTKTKIAAAQKWTADYGTFGVFIARLLPVIRHLISIPAGLLKMNFLRFSIATITGAGIWCYILSWFGEKTLGAHPELLDSPEAMMHAVRVELLWFVVGTILFSGLYVFISLYKRKTKGA